MPDDGQRLYLGQVDVVEGENGKHLGQTAFLMGQREYEARLVGMLYLPHEIGLVGMAYHQKAGKVVLVVLDMVFQYLHAIEPGGIGMADGRPTLAAVTCLLYTSPSPRD